MMKNALILITCFLRLSSLYAAEVHVIPSEPWQTLWEKELQKADMANGKQHYANAAQAYKRIAKSKNPTIPNDIRRTSKERLQNIAQQGLTRVNIVSEEDLKLEAQKEQEVKQFIARLCSADAMLAANNYSGAKEIYKEINENAPYLFMNIWAASRLGRISYYEYLRGFTKRD